MSTFKAWTETFKIFAKYDNETKEPLVNAYSDLGIDSRIKPSDMTKEDLDRLIKLNCVVPTDHTFPDHWCLLFD